MDTKPESFWETREIHSHSVMDYILPFVKIGVNIISVFFLRNTHFLDN